jgi:hypothetical protein
LAQEDLIWHLLRFYWTEGLAEEFASNVGCAVRDHAVIGQI